MLGSDDGVFPSLVCAKERERREQLQRSIQPGRRSKIEAEILRVRPDVVVLVELDKRFDIGMQLDIHGSYKSIWKKKKKDFYEDGTGIFYCTQRLRKLDELMVFIETDGKVNDQVIVAVELGPADDNHVDDYASFVVAGLHLKSTKAQKGEKMRLAQSKDVWKTLREKWPKKEIILTADLNAEAKGYESGKLNYEPEAHPWLLAQGLQSVYPVVAGKEPFVTSWKKRVPPDETKKAAEFKYTIDFIFATSGIIPRAVLGMPDEAQFEEIKDTLLPSEQCGSDHLPLVCELNFPSGPPRKISPRVKRKLLSRVSISVPRVKPALNQAISLAQRKLAMRDALAVLNQPEDERKTGIGLAAAKAVHAKDEKLMDLVEKYQDG